MTGLALAAVLCLDLSAPSMAKTRSPTLRDQAEHACYDDVMKLCNDEVPDEVKVEACMKRKRAQLSPGCLKLFDLGRKEQ